MECMAPRGKRVTIPKEIIDKLQRQGEIDIDRLGRVRGFQGYIKRLNKRGGI